MSIRLGKNKKIKKTQAVNFFRNTESGNRRCLEIAKNFKEIVGAVVIFDHGLKFRIIFLVSDHPARKKMITSKILFLLSIK